MTLVYGPEMGLLESAATGETFDDAFRKFLRGVDALVFCRVVSRTLTAPPGSPANGALYIPNTGATGAWSGKANQLARYSSTAGWEFYAPKAQWRIRCVADGYDYVYSGSAWALQEKPMAQITGLQAALDAKAAITALDAKADRVATLVDEATTARTLALADADKIIRCSNAAATTITLSSTVAYTAGMRFRVRAAGAAGVTLAGDGVTLNAASLALAQHTTADIVMVSATEADVL